MTRRRIRRRSLLLLSIRLLPLLSVWSLINTVAEVERQIRDPGLSSQSVGATVLSDPLLCKGSDTAPHQAMEEFCSGTNDSLVCISLPSWHRHRKPELCCMHSQKPRKCCCSELWNEAVAVCGTMRWYCAYALATFWRQRLWVTCQGLCLCQRLPSFMSEEERW